jgi:hypothetical protein
MVPSQAQQLPSRGTVRACISYYCPSSRFKLVRIVRRLFERERQEAENAPRMLASQLHEQSEECDQVVPLILWQRDSATLDTAILPISPGAIVNPR